MHRGGDALTVTVGAGRVGRRRPMEEAILTLVAEVAEVVEVAEVAEVDNVDDVVVDDEVNVDEVGMG